MTPIENRKNDSKLLLAIGGLVVVGAAGIALIGALTLDEPDETGRTGSAPARRAARAVDTEPAMPAFGTVTDGAVLPASQEAPAPLPVAAADEAEDVFSVDPLANFVARGLETYASREFDRAALYFQAEVEARPGGAWSHYMLGLSLWKAGRVDEAEGVMVTATDLDPGSLKSFVNLARIRNAQGDFDGALEAARAGLALEPEAPSALFLEGRSLFNLGRLEEAANSLIAGVAIAPEHGHAHNLLGLTRIGQQRAPEAVPVLERAADLLPEVAYIHNNLGMALELSGRTAEAFAAYRRGAEADPTHARVVANLARLEPVVGEDALVAPPASGRVAQDAEAPEAPAAADPVEVASASGQVGS